MKNKNLSPFQIALKKLLSNTLAVIGLIIISTFLIIAVLGPLIRPDDTPKANNQHLELARKSPGFTIEFLKVPIDKKVGRSVFSGFLFGFPSEEFTIPVYSYRLLQDSIQVEKYTGNTPNDGLVVSYHKSRFKKFAASEIIHKEKFWLGTDRYGRDLLSRLMAGTWVSFSVGIISIIISLFIGITLGAMAGYFGGKVDNFIMWLINVVWSIPTLLLVIAIILALGKSFWQVFIAVGLTMWVEVARVVRGQVISTKQKEFVEAGKSFGFKNSRIIFKHILPNITGPIIVISAANFAAAILIEAGLSFLGLGAQPPQATWGKMISEHKGYIITGEAYLAIFPGIAICLLVLAFVFLGSGLRDAFDTKGVKSLNL